MLKLETELAKISGIGEKFLKRFKKLEINSVRDLLWHFPSRYEDFSKVLKIEDLQINQAATVCAEVKKISMRRSWRKNMVIIEALLADETGGIKAIWFNQPYIARILRVGEQANFAGKITASDDEIYFSSPTYELARGTSETKHTARLIPIYPETKSLTSKGIRFLIKPILTNLEKLTEFIPASVLKKNNLPEINTALKRIHFPAILEDAEQARNRFAFENIFLLQLNNLKARWKLSQEKAPSLKISREELEGLIAKLPFQLTDSQNKSLKEILEDLAAEKPMNRLLQGDVGSGKTVVAAVVAVVAAKNDKQTAIMAPTEVLARQHYKTLTAIFKELPVGIGLLTSGEARSFYGNGLEAKRKKDELLEEIESGKIKIIIGTHSLISSSKNKDQVIFKDLALAIVDEQHRFGVEQRAALVKKEKDKGSETTVHFFSMSATPIPRTLSLSLFGDLDLSIIDELPKGRKPILTKVVDPTNRTKAYKFVREQIQQGRQAFVIYPRIESAKEVSEGGIVSKQYRLWNEIKAVKAEYEKLSKQVFPDLRVAMLHGRMKSGEKEKIMSAFSAGEIDILVSTSVVEVGVDVPNASIMLIEGADRFGLAQLYQFRGRVGRGEHQSFVFLFTDSSSDSTKRRLDALLKAKNGFELAEQDLAIRGPGQFLGDKQTGLPDLAMRSLNNMALVKSARESAVEIIKKDPELNNYPNLEEKLSVFQKEIHLE